MLTSDNSAIKIEPTATSKDKKRKFALPWWCALVAWLLLAVSVLVSAAFVTFYGIMFADVKCKKWITSMLVSFLTSVFLTQPIKVFLLSYLWTSSRNPLWYSSCPTDGLPHATH